MNIAILGLGTVGFGVYDIIEKSDYLNNVKVKYVLDKDLKKQNIVKANVVDDYQIILEDEEIEVIIETMGAGDFSYKCIKEALLKKKNVITANKEVIALHLSELTMIKNKMKVCLLYEASVGGGIPLIYNLFETVKINKINKIYGILNGTTNFILSQMTDKNLSFKEALKLAQDKGFAEADPTADLEGLDMVRKIAILSSISYKGIIDINKIYHYGITTISLDDILFLKQKDLIIKFIAYSSIDNLKATILIEPVVVKNNHILSNVNDEFNIVSIDSNINGNLIFYGKGAGRYPTANAIINDLISIIEKRNNPSFENINEIEYIELIEKHSYFLHANEKIEEKYVLEKNNDFIITIPLTRGELNKLLNKVVFYARMIK